MSMKCLCGYEYEDYWETKMREPVVTKGDQKFLEISGKFTARYEDSWSSGIGMHDVSIYACPKCHTLQVELS